MQKCKCMVYYIVILLLYIDIISCHYLFIGKTGCGKSWIIDGLTDHKYNVTSELKPGSTTTENTYYDEYIDTIGFDDTNLGKYENMPLWLKRFVPNGTNINGISVGLLAIYDSLYKIKQYNKQLNKIIFVIDDIKVSDTQRSILKILRTIIKSDLLLIENKVFDIAETKNAYEKSKTEFQDIFGLHEIFYFSRAQKESTEYKTQIKALKNTLTKYEKNHFKYELNQNHIGVILNGDPDFILNYYKELNCDDKRSRLKEINGSLSGINIDQCDYNITNCKVCNAEVIGQDCPGWIPSLWRGCGNIIVDICNYNNDCINNAKIIYDGCLDRLKTGNAEKTVLIEETKDIQRYLIDKCDISKLNLHDIDREL